MRPIVDSHIHFWHVKKLHYEWLSGVQPLNRTFAPNDLVVAAAHIDLQKIVFVQADCVPEDGLREVAWVTELAQTEPRIQGIVAFAPLDQRKTAVATLDQLQQYPLVKGVRRLIQDEPLGFARQPDFVWGVQQLAERNLSFDICIRHWHLPDMIALVEQCPDVAFVLDHLGKPAIKHHLLEPWATHLRTLAEFPHVWCKLSGLVTEADHQQWTEADLRPYLDVALEAFGTNRLMFGGDWPVSELATSYQRWVETAVSMLSALSEAEKNQMFFENTQTFYRLGD